MDFRILGPLEVCDGGDVLNVSYGPFAQSEAGRLEELRAVATEDRLEAELAMGEHVGAVAELEVLVGQRPLRERLWGLLMVALYRSGRQGEALQAAAQARRILREELGVEPGLALRRLESDILAQAPSLEPSALTQDTERPRAPAGPAAARPPASASDTTGELVGRERPLATLLGALDRARGGSGQLVLVSGEPGIGQDPAGRGVGLARRPPGSDGGLGPGV